MYEGADDSIPTSMDSMEACCSLENCCVDSDDLAKLAAAATSTEEEDEGEDDDADVDEEEEEEGEDDDHHHEEDRGAGQDDLDASLDPFAFATSHEEHTIESHLRIRRRQQKQQSQRQELNNDCRRVVAETGKAFIPFSEETMFCDSNDMAPPHNVNQSSRTANGHVDTSSPVSSDSWMNYSSHSSDDYSFIMESTRRGSMGSVEAASVSGAGGGSPAVGDHQRRRGDSMDSASIVPKNKRNRDSFKFRKDQSIDEGDSQLLLGGVSGEGDTSCDHHHHHHRAEDEEGDNESVDETLAHLQINQPKRLRGKEPEAGAVNANNGGGGGGSGRSGGKSVNSSRRSSTNAPQLVDIRIIDFAHTAFAKRNSNGGGVMMPPTPQGKADSTPAVHKGPDCGFLTGVDSLKRLLQEILPGDGANTSNLMNMVE